MKNRINEERLFKRWLPFQTEMSFEDFKNRLSINSNKKLDNRNSKEILNNVKNILENFKAV